MKTTANYGFNKPEGTDVVNIDDFNSNADAIDVELAKRAMKADIPIKTSQLNNDSGFITSGGAPVLSINGKVGNIALVSSDIGAEPAITKNTAFNQNFETNVSNMKMNGTASVGTSGNVSRADHVHPSDTAKVNQSDFNAHLADNLYQTAGGTATAITLTISETLVTGFPITFIASANNAGAATTINMKPLYKPSTVIAPNLIAGKAYTVWYNSASGGCFFIKASAEGTAVVANVLAGTTFSNDTDTGLNGAMVNLGSPTYTVSTTDQLIIGFINGGKVKGEAALLAANIVAPNVIGGITGTAKEKILIPHATIVDSSWADGGTSNSSTSYVIHPGGKRTTMSCRGTIRISFQLAIGTTGTAYGKIYKNGVAVGTERTSTNPSGVTFTEDFTCVPGDYFEIYTHQTTNTAWIFLYQTLCTTDISSTLS
jgi:hypothetical protein